MRAKPRRAPRSVPAHNRRTDFSALVWEASGLRASTIKRLRARRPIVAIAAAKAVLAMNSGGVIERAPPPEWRRHLAEETLRVVRLEEAERFNLLLLRTEIGSEHEVPDDEAVGVIVVRLGELPRMVPAMHLRAAHDVIQE